MSAFSVKPAMAPKFFAVLLVPIVLIFLYLALLCFRWTLADILQTQVDFFLETVNTDSTNKTVKDWRIADSQLAEALRLRQSNSRYLETAESFYQILDTLEADAPALLAELGWKGNEPKALEFARAGLALKPTWPYLWKQLVLSKLGLKQYDNELSGALEKVISLGLYQKNIVYEISALGIADWEHLDPKSRLSVMQALDFFILLNKDSKLDETYLLNYLNAAHVCAIKDSSVLNGFEVLERYCRTAQEKQK